MTCKNVPFYNKNDFRCKNKWEQQHFLGGKKTQTEKVNSVKKDEWLHKWAGKSRNLITYSVSQQVLILEQVSSNKSDFQVTSSLKNRK